MKTDLFQSAGCRVLVLSVALTAVVLLVFSDAAAARVNKPLHGNRLTYLDDYSNPYYPNLAFPKLVTPQWVGEVGVEAVITLGVDDMRAVDRYEAFLRPILERLKKIDGRAPVSIVTNSIEPQHPHLQKWLDEGVTIETHTADHPCPCLRDGDFDKAKDTYDRCVDQISAIPGNHPVAFRFPCCDSLNTPSPRAFAEIINSKTPQGNFLQLSSSICAPFTADDPTLPRDLVLNTDRTPRFSRYIPFELFANKVENYPYPFVVGKLCWEFPIAVPSDWQGQKLQKPNNPRTVSDLKAMLDITVQKRGVANVVFHPHGWIRPDQMVALVDHVVAQYGSKVRFLNFRECLDRLNQNLLAGQSLRSADGSDNGVRLLDLDNDGFLDVVIGNGQLKQTRLWRSKTEKWIESPFPVSIVRSEAGAGAAKDAGVRFGVLTPAGNASFLVRNEQTAGIWHFQGGVWQQDREMLKGLSIEGKPVMTVRDGVDQGVRLRDLDGDGVCEVIVSNPEQNAVFAWNKEKDRWQQMPFSLPAGTAIVDALGRDAGLRLIDINEDGRDDVLFSDDWSFALYLFDSMKTGWSRKVFSGARGDEGTIPAIVLAGKNNGAWFADRHMWVQNENTTRLPGGVDRRSFGDLLGHGPARPKNPASSLKCIEVPEGFKVELVAAEPLLRDPVAFDWGPDGRLWVVEMNDYPEGLDGEGKPGGSVRVLEDTDGDGRYDTSTPFLDGLSFPTGIMVWRDGVLITAAPDVLYAEDTDGDGRAEGPKVLFTGFGLGNQQHRVNGLVYGLDHWVYLANGSSGGNVAAAGNEQRVDVRGRDIRIDPDAGKIDMVSGQTQYGRDRDDWGNWFGCNNPNPIFHFVLDDHYLRRNPHFNPPNSMRDILNGSRRVFPTGPVISHCDTRIRPIGAPTIFTSAGSTIVYRDDLFGPTYAQNTFTSEPAWNLIHRRQLLPDGTTFQSERLTGEAESEFFRSSDSWCRPTRVRVGPDGALYVADMYRRVIEHPKWIDDELEQQIDVRDGHDRGRLYRISPVASSVRKTDHLEGLSTPKLVAALESASGFQRDLAQRLLIWRADPEATDPLENMARTSKQPLARLHALATLDRLGLLSEETLLQALKDPHPGLRRHAVRMAENFLPSPSEPLAEALLRLADDPDSHVQLQLAYTLGEWPSAEAGALLGKLAVRHAGKPYLSAAVISSLTPIHVAAALDSAVAALEVESLDKLVAFFGTAAALGDRQLLERVLTATLQYPESGASAVAQLKLFRAVLEARMRQGDQVEDVLAATPQRPLSALLQYARKLLADPNADFEARQTAIRFLFWPAIATENDLGQVARLLSAQHPLQLQTTAATALANLGTPEALELLFAALPGQGPRVRSSVLDLLLSLPRVPELLLEKIEQGDIQAAQVDLMRQERLLKHPVEQIRMRAKKIFANRIDEDRSKVLSEHRDVHSLTGDPSRGKIVFEKQCGNCHRFEDVGAAVGSDLAGLRDRSAEALLVAILDPNRAVEAKYLQYDVLTRDGRIVSGIISSESGNNIVLTGADGKQHPILRTEIEELITNSRSLMPEGLEKELSKQQLADVISYIAAASGNP